MISVVTPVRNGETYLDEAIRSVLAQTLRAWQYVIVDGGSSDGSRAIAEAYAARDPRITVISEPNQSMYEAIFKGLDRGSAPLCCWINADDRFLPWAFELVARYWLACKADWITGLPAAMDADGLVHTIEGGRWYPQLVLRRGLCHGKALGFLQQEGTFFSRQLLARLDGAVLEDIRTTRQAGDFLLWRALARLTSVHMIPTVLGAFRMHDQNLTRDKAAYYAEIRAHGAWLPPRAVATALKCLFVPLGFAMYKRRLRAWRTIVRRLPPESSERSTRRGDGRPQASRPLVSIITVVLNRSETLGRTIESVLGQSYAPIEYIVIDGGSTDGTVEVIRRYADRLAHWVSEPDRGISDAFNKGLAAARGDHVGLLNADDWLEPDQIERAVAALERTGADFVFGDLIYHAADGRAMHRIKGDPDYGRSIRRVMPAVNHPTMLVRRSVYEAVGGFALGYRYSMDYDWLLRAHHAGFRGVYEPRLTGHMSLGGAGDENHLGARAEGREIAIRHGLPAVLAWLLYFFRIVKGSSRRTLERLAPAPVYNRLRRLINRSYQPDA